jgi:DNA-binding response OmpR family regulator
MTNIKALLLQDNTAFTHPIEKMIEEPGFEVLRVLASASDELLKSIFTLQPDLIICEDSYSKLILSAERRIKKNIPIVFVGANEGGFTEMPIPNRPTAYLKWPFTGGVLRAMIHLLI